MDIILHGQCECFYDTNGRLKLLLTTRWGVDMKDGQGTKWFETELERTKFLETVKQNDC